MTIRPDTARLSETAQHLMEEHHLPGLALGAVFDGDEVSGLRFQTLFDLRRNPEAQPWT